MSYSGWRSDPKWWERAIRGVLKPLSRVVGRVSWRFGRKHLISDIAIINVKDKLRPGMTILTKSNHSLSNLFIKGKYKHTAIVINEDTIVDATGEGVRQRSLFALLAEADQFCVLSPDFASILDMRLATRVALDLVGKPYDYDFDFNPHRNEAYYCAEIQWQSYHEICKVVPFEPTLVLGEYTLYPSSFYTSGNWSIIHESPDV